MPNRMLHRQISCRSRAFTMPELLVVIGVIALLIIVLLPALAGALRTGDMASSMNRMRQIGTFMQLYSSENREYILPSEFNYAAAAAPPNNFPVKVRSHADLTATPWGNLQYSGTWADILWTVNDLGKSQVLGEKYRYDSPDQAIYDTYTDYEEDPLRSTAPNSKNFPTGIYPGVPGPRPYGAGAQEAGSPGFFAANNFFNTTGSGSWYTTGQIKVPDRSMYLVDSFAGETIDPVITAGVGPDPYNNEEDPAGPKRIEVDFRYNGNCLMLFLDGHIDPEGPWKNLEDLEGCMDASTGIKKGRGVRIRDLTNRSLPDCQ